MTQEHNERAPIPQTYTGAQVADDAPIHHLKITIGPGSNKELHFGLEYVGNGPQKNRKIFQYAKGIADRHNHIIEGKSNFRVSKIQKILEILLNKNKSNTPFDLPKLEGSMCWIMLELDGDLNWGFEKGEAGVSMKRTDDKAGDYGLRFVFKGVQPDHKPVQSVPTDQVGPCQIAYWAVPYRKAGTIKGFNFHIEFYQRDSNNDFHSLPTIFDPNVPNTGGAGIPS
ncbi:nucleotide synthetase [Caulobacter sp. NIBR1757]|uniref:nucleotide synthetase n=1 Tax=Caulobacter sp. NIBR1757 TaxID=3016000 RepID=UPI0022EFEAE7|nr:nucleotide synthetase [Caulobacter sp. NIBR1757]WGM40383.1 hypothetical protein AMEJIAPC_03328 [Caulobacter sp. NIBR1757]